MPSALNRVHEADASIGAARARRRPGVPRARRLAIGLAFSIAALAVGGLLAALLPGGLAQDGMRPVTALGLLLLAIAALTLLSPRSRRRASLFAACLSAVLAVASLWPLSADWNVSLGWLLGFGSLSGEMLAARELPLGSASTLLLASAALALLIVRPEQPRTLALTRVVGGLMLTLGIVALIGNMMHLETLSSWYLRLRMETATAFAICLLALLLWLIAELHDGATRLDEATTLQALATSAPLAIALLAGLTGAALFKSQADQAMLDSLHSSQQARLDVLTTSLDLHSERAALLAQQLDAIRADAASFDGLDVAATERRLTIALDRALRHGFSRLELRSSRDRLVYRAGRTPGAVAVELPVRREVTRSSALAWTPQSLVLRDRIRFEGPSGGAWTLITEQPLPALDDHRPSGAHSEGGTRVELCSNRGQDLLCLPSGTHTQPYVLPLTSSGTAIERAAAGQRGVDVFRSEDSAATIMAYSPVGSTELVTVSSLDADAFYSPVRARVLWGFLLVGGITLIGTLMVQRLVRQQARALVGARNLYRTVINSLQEGIVLRDREQRIIAINARARSIIGQDDDATRDDAQLLLDNDAAWRLIREDGSPWPREDWPDLRTLRDDSIGSSLVMGLERPDGERRWLIVDTHRVPMDADAAPGGVLTSFTDVTEQYRAAQDLARSNQLRQSIINSAPFAIVATDPQGIIRDFNPAAEALLGYARDNMIGLENLTRLHDPRELAQRVSELLAESTRRTLSDFDALVHNARLYASDGREWQMLRSDRSTVPVHLTLTALRDPAGEISGFLGIAYDISERKRREAYTEHIAHHDHLTGLPNRVLLHDRLGAALLRARKAGGAVAALMVDLDHFKRINDSLGHFVGDELLRIVSQRLQRCVRTGDTVARMGGDEFVVLLADIKDVGAVERVAREIISRVAEPVEIGGHELLVSASAGVSLYPHDARDTEALLKHADTAMYEAKAAGRHAYRMFSPEMGRRAAVTMELESALRRALASEELQIHYQPQICLRTGAIEGIEALMRWTDPQHGVVSPTQFIAVAEQTGLIVALGEWALRRACRDARWLQQQTGVDLRLAVNLAPRQFRLPGLESLVRGACTDAGLAPAHLELEITENTLMQDSEEMIERLRQLRAHGVGIAIDDFGTGYSSLAYVSRFPIDALKIEQSFVRHMTDTPSNAAVIHAIVALAQSLGLRVIAEGVESAEQLAFLHESGEARPLGRRRAQPSAMSVQGFLFTPGLPAAQLADEFPRLQAEARERVERLGVQHTDIDARGRRLR